MSNDPVGRKLFRAGRLADAQPQKRWEAVSVAPGRALQNAMPAGDRNHEDSRARDRKSTVVDRHCMRSNLYALSDLASGKIKRTFSEVDLQRRISDGKRLRERDVWRDTASVRLFVSPCSLRDSCCKKAKKAHRPPELVRHVLNPVSPKICRCRMEMASVIIEAALLNVHLRLFVQLACDRSNFASNLFLSGSTIELISSKERTGCSRFKKLGERCSAPRCKQYAELARLVGFSNTLNCDRALKRRLLFSHHRGDIGKKLLIVE